MSTPKALELADKLDAFVGLHSPISAELRRQHAEIERLRKVEDEWARLSQDEGKAEREIERLTAENFALAAGQCVNATADEGGRPYCREISRLTTELSKQTRAADALDKMYVNATVEIDRLEALCKSRSEELDQTLQDLSRKIAECERLTAERDALRAGPAPLTDAQIDAAINAWFTTEAADPNAFAYLRQLSMRERMRAAIDAALKGQP